MKRTLPPRISGVKLGRKVYLVVTKYASQRQLKAIMGAPKNEKVHYRGLWENRLGDRKRLAGIIYVHRSMSPTLKRSIYDHEMRHAVHDIIEWDSEN